MGDGSLDGNGLLQRPKHVIDDVGIDHLLTESAQMLHCFDKSLARVQTPIPPCRQIDAELFFWKVTHAHVVSTRPRFYAKSALFAAFVIERELDRRFVADHGCARVIREPIERGYNPQRFCHQLIMISPIREVETEHDVQ